MTVVGEVPCALPVDCALPGGETVAFIGSMRSRVGDGVETDVLVVRGAGQVEEDVF